MPPACPDAVRSPTGTAGRRARAHCKRSGRRKPGKGGAWTCSTEPKRPGEPNGSQTLLVSPTARAPFRRSHTGHLRMTTGAPEIIGDIPVTLAARVAALRNGAGPNLTAPDRGT